MANTIITKNSSTASSVPSAASLTQGELAVNVTDKKLYTKNASGTVVEITPSVSLSTSGNAATATALQTGRTIGGVSFNGTANIDLPGVNTEGNQNTSGNAATATKLATARTISLTGDVSGSVSFDGSANASITAVVADGSHNHAAGDITSGTIATARLGSGTASSSTYLRGDQTWAAVDSAPATGGQVFTSSGTFTVPSGVTAVKVTVIGGGGGGRDAESANYHGSGGGGGGGAIKYITGLTPGNTVSVTVGAGGGSSASGGTSSFGAYCSATGGSTGNKTFSTTSEGAGGAGGTGAGGDINWTGGQGGNSITNTSTGGTIMFGGDGGGSSGQCGTISFALAGASDTVTYIANVQNGGGSGYYGGRGGRWCKTGINGDNATGYGCGGGGNAGVSSSAVAGSGKSGIVVVEW